MLHISFETLLIFLEKNIKKSSLSVLWSSSGVEGELPLMLIGGGGEIVGQKCL